MLGFGDSYLFQFLPEWGILSGHIFYARTVAYINLIIIMGYLFPFLFSCCCNSEAQLIACYYLFCYCSNFEIIINIIIIKLHFWLISYSWCRNVCLIQMLLHHVSCIRIHVRHVTCTGCLRLRMRNNASRRETVYTHLRTCLRHYYPYARLARRCRFFLVGRN